MEALCCNLPIICSDIRGNNDLIENKRNGFLVKNNTKEYTKKINFLVKNDLYKKIDINNSEILKKIDIKNIEENMKKIYLENKGK